MYVCGQGVQGKSLYLPLFHYKPNTALKKKNKLFKKVRVWETYTQKGVTLPQTTIINWLKYKNNYLKVLESNQNAETREKPTLERGGLF